MPCWNYQSYEGEYGPGKVFCSECGEVFNHRAETEEGGTYSHRCNTWVELWPGKFAHCALPTHAGECIGEVVTNRPIQTHYDKPEREPVRVYTDGGCYRDGIGGWGWYEPISKRREFGSDYPTTNQRMEMTAAFEALDTFMDEPNLTIVSDSAYVINAMNNKWYERWQSNGWVNAKGDAVANKDLWLKLIKVAEDHGSVKWEKVKGHSGDHGNEEADKLATKGMLDFLMSRRRIDELREMLHVHSYVYYVLKKTVVSDKTWNEMAEKLIGLHKQYPHSKEQGYEASYFKNFTGETGADMPWTEHVKDLAEKMLDRQEIIEKRDK